MPSVDEIFLGAREIAEASARADFLAEACRGDPDLRRRVEAMLQDASAADDYFGSTGGLGAGGRASAELRGTVIGRYKLLEKIGEGGMGLVYMAGQHEPMTRKVALKIIKAGMDSHQVIARFEAERQALALMDHPNIAQVLDGGETGDGRPYFVMELVQGLPITQFCDEAKLSPRERLELFVDVCCAIQHAHQKGIIHRDIKPSNILVTLHGDKPVPKVIDFGVAKATQQPLTDKTLFTQFQHFIGTPAYMSPEQASLSGLDIDTRSDLYALGVLLYELLTGKTPFDGSQLLKSGLDEMRRTIREVEPPRPSMRLSEFTAEELTTTAQRRRIEAPRLIRVLRGDLDWIVMKCLEKDRARRYETANGLMADVQRHLHNEPVTARPPSAAYRLQKAVRRNKPACAAALAVALAVLGGIAATSYQAVKARRAEVRATQQFEIARATKDFFIGQLLGLMSPLLKGTFDATNYALAHRIAQQVEGKFPNQPLVEADVRWALGEAFWGIDDYAGALAQYQRAFELRRRELGMVHSDTFQAIAGVGAAEYELGHHQASERILDAAVALIHGPPRIVSRGAAQVLCTKGWRWMATGRARESMPYLQESLEMYRATGADAQADVQDEMTQVYWSIASATEGMGKAEEADKLFEEGTRRCQRVHGTNHAWVANFLKSHALALRTRKRLDEAGEKLRQAAAIFASSLGPEHTLTQESENYLAQVLEAQGHVDDAAASFTRLHQRARRHLPNLRARWTCHDCARFFVRQERFAEARAVYADLAAAFRAVPPERLGDFEECLTATAASEGWRAAADFCRSNFDFFSNDLALWRTKASVFLYAGDTNAYQGTLTRVLARTAVLTNSADAKTILEIASLGPCRLSREQTDCGEAAVRALEDALAGMPSNAQGAAHRAIGGMQLRLGQFSGGLAHLEAALTHSPSGLERARVLNLKGLCLYRLGRAPDARSAFDETEELLKSRLLDGMSTMEGFLDLTERTCLLQYRELAGLIGRP